MTSPALLLTNDYPPRPGGIQTFVGQLADRVDRPLVVVAPTWRGDRAYDAARPHEVIRVPRRVLLPGPGLLDLTTRVARRTGATDVWFGAAAPLGLLAPALRRRGLRPAVALTHGHETGWALLPGARHALRRVGREVDAVTALGTWTAGRLRPVLGPDASLHLLWPGVDSATFTPAADGAAVRRRLGIDPDAPVVVCVSRLMPRKGQDVLVAALPEIRRRVPGAVLLLVGGGPRRQALLEAARATGVGDAVVVTGSVPAAELAAHHRAGDVFAMPCRSRGAGLDVEGLGIVFLEAAATGRPVVAGRSGGAPDALVPGQTGVLVDGREVAEVTDAVAGLLTDRERAAEMGQAGRRWVEDRWGWDEPAARLGRLLAAAPALG